MQESIVCVHPGASRIEGRRAVMASFVDLFIDAPILRFSIIDALHTGNQGMAVHLVREEIQLDGFLVNTLVSTNIYHQEAEGWRMLLHHASPEPDAAFQEEFDNFQDFESLDMDEFDDELDEFDEPSPPPVLH